MSRIGLYCMVKRHVRRWLVAAIRSRVTPMTTGYSNVQQTLQIYPRPLWCITIQFYQRRIRSLPTKPSVTIGWHKRCFLGYWQYSLHHDSYRRTPPKVQLQQVVSGRNHVTCFWRWVRWESMFRITTRGTHVVVSHDKTRFAKRPVIAFDPPSLRSCLPRRAPLEYCLFVCTTIIYCLYSHWFNRKDHRSLIRVGTWWAWVLGRIVWLAVIAQCHTQNCKVSARSEDFLACSSPPQSCDRSDYIKGVKFAIST